MKKNKNVQSSITVYGIKLKQITFGRRCFKWETFELIPFPLYELEKGLTEKKKKRNKNKRKKISFSFSTFLLVIAAYLSNGDITVLSNTFIPIVHLVFDILAKY